MKTMSTWRLLSLEEKDDSFLKMAKEEAIMNAVRKKESPPTLRFYAWNKPAVSLGFFQENNNVLNIDACKEDNIEIFRRITGGGAVYKSPSYEINYSFIIREDDIIPKDVLSSYELICKAIITGLSKYNLDLKFKPINDITIFDKKISGNAQTRIDNVILQHGTILLKSETETMFKYLKIDKETLLKKKVKDTKELVTGIHDYVFLSKKEIQDAIVEGFKKTFNVTFIETETTDNEKKEAKNLYSKYFDPKFIYWK